MLQFQVVRVVFPATTGREQSVSSWTGEFSGPVKSANLALNGFDVSFKSADHHLRQVKLDCSTPVIISGKRVNFTVTYLLRDNSGNIDDPYQGWADVLIIAEV
jgi:hypothetical protein